MRVLAGGNDHVQAESSPNSDSLPGHIVLRHSLHVPGHTDLSPSVLPSLPLLPPSAENTFLHLRQHLFFVHRILTCSTVASVVNIPKLRIFFFSPSFLLSLYLPNAVNSQCLADWMGKKIQGAKRNNKRIYQLIFHSVIQLRLFKILE